MKTRAQKFKILLSALLVILLAATGAYADLLFTRQASYSDPVSLGIITGSEAPFSPLQSNMGGNSGNGIRPFLDADGRLRVALTFYTGVGSNTSDTVDIYDPGPRSGWAKPANWDKPIKEFTCSTKNIRAMATIGNYLYATGYDKAVISRIVMTNDAYAEDKVWTHPGVKGELDGGLHGEGLFSYDGCLYAIITSTAGDPMNPSVSYGPNQIWKFDKDLNVIASADMIGRNMDGQNDGVYTRDGGKLYVCSFGGYQVITGGYNENTTIEVCDLETLKSTLLARGEETQARFPEWFHMFSGIAFIGGRVFLHGTTWTVPQGKPGGHAMVVFETTREKLASGDIGTRIGGFGGSYGIQMGFNYDPETGYLWARAGGCLERYEGGSSWTEFNDNVLKGILSAAAPLSVGSSAGPDAVMPTEVTIAPSDISADGAELEAAETNLNAPKVLARSVRSGGYSAVIDGGGRFSSVKILSTLKVALSGGGEEVPVSFAIKGLDYEPADGVDICVMLRKTSKPQGKYDLFPASLEDGLLTFTISPYGEYFSDENTLVVAETEKAEIPEPEKPWGGESGSAGGCDAGLGALALLALAIPALGKTGAGKKVLRRRKR